VQGDPLASPGPLTSRAKRVSAARRLAKRAYRSADRRFLAEGPQAVREALAREAAHPGAVVEVFATADAAQRHPELLAAARGCGLPVHAIGDEAMASIAQTVTPQGVVAICSFLDVPLEVASAAARLVAVLAHVRDPGNAGTVIRAADAAGADAVVLTDASVDPYNGKCVRASAGSLFHLPVSTGVPVADAVRALRAAGLRVVAADGSGEDLDDVDAAGGLAGPTAWIFGNEAWGLPPETLALADAVVRVPIHGAAESLNLATAVGVVLFEALRQRYGW